MFAWIRRFLTGSSSYRRLLHHVLGDEAKAERLIQFEINRAAGLSREQAARRAVERIEYDRGR